MTTITPLESSSFDRAATPEEDGSRGDFRLRDSLGRRIGEAIELRRGPQAIAYTGERFLVAHVDARRQISVTAIGCGG